MKKLFFLIALLTTSPAFADTYLKIDDDTFSVTKTVVEKVDIEAIKSNRQSLQNSCDEQLASYDAQIIEAQKVGVE